MKTQNVSRLLGSALLCAFVGAVVMQAQVGIYGIGDLSGGDAWSEVRGAILTGSGIIAVGSSDAKVADGGEGGVFGDTAVVWTQAGNSLQALTNVGGSTANVFLTASDIRQVSMGNYIIAARTLSAASGNAREGVLYNFNGTAETGNTPISGMTAATGLSSNGSVAYGFAGTQLVRYTGGTTTPLGFFGTDTASMPAGRGASADGSVVVGTRGLTNLTNQAYIYTGGSFTSIGLLPGGSNSRALGVSADGLTVFGNSQSTAHPDGEAFFWTSGGGFTALGAPSGMIAGNGGGITADGSAAVIYFFDMSGVTSYLYNSHGAFDLTTVLATGSVDLTGWTNLQATGISDDGQLIFGLGTHGGDIEGFVAQVPLGLVSAIPEPATYGVLGGLAALGLTLGARRKRLA